MPGLKPSIMWMSLQNLWMPVGRSRWPCRPAQGSPPIVSWRSSLAFRELEPRVELPQTCTLPPQGTRPPRPGPCSPYTLVTARHVVITTTMSPKLAL